MEGLDSSTAAYRTESEGSTTSEDRDLSLRAFLEKESLGHLIALFPDDVSIGYFQALTEDDLEHDYNVKDDKERELLMHSIVKLREEFSADEVSNVSSWTVSLLYAIDAAFLTNYFRPNFMFGQNTSIRQVIY